MTAASSAIAALLLAGAPLAIAPTAAQQATPPAPAAPPAPATSPAPAPDPAAQAPVAGQTPVSAAAPAAPDAAALPASPLDVILMSAHPLAFPPKGNIAKVTKSQTANCAVTIGLEDGRSVVIDLKSATNLSTNTSLMIHQKGSGVQFEFDGKGGAADAAKADKALSDLSDKCS